MEVNSFQIVDVKSHVTNKNKIYIGKYFMKTQSALVPAIVALRPYVDDVVLVFGHCRWLAPATPSRGEACMRRVCLTRGDVHGLFLEYYCFPQMHTIFLYLVTHVKRVNTFTIVEFCYAPY